MDIEKLRAKRGFLCDMDGVIYQGNRLIDGVKDFVNWLNENHKRYLFLTNSSERSPRELKMKLERLGLDVGIEHFYTSALATAKFLANQSPGCSAYVIGEPGLVGALYEVGIDMNDVDPQYVVCGETRNYNYESIIRAVRLVQKGARLIGTNPDLTGPDETGIIPAIHAAGYRNAFALLRQSRPRKAAGAHSKRRGLYKVIPVSPHRHRKHANRSRPESSHRQCDPNIRCEFPYNGKVSNPDNPAHSCRSLS